LNPRSGRVRSALRFAGRVLSRVLLVTFILLMAVLPIPLGNFVRVVLRPRRNEVTKVEKKEEDG
jgi:hypothetical protein